MDKLAPMLIGAENASPSQGSRRPMLILSWTNLALESEQVQRAMKPVDAMFSLEDNTFPECYRAKSTKPGEIPITNHALRAYLRTGKALAFLAALSVFLLACRVRVEGSGAGRERS